MLFDTTRWNLSIVQFNLKMDKSHLDSVFVLQLKDILQIDNGNGQGKPFNVTVLLNPITPGGWCLAPSPVENLK